MVTKIDLLIQPEDKRLTAYQEDIVNTCIRVFSKFLDIDEQVTLLKWETVFNYLRKVEKYSNDDAVLEMLMYFGQSFRKLHGIYINPRLNSNVEDLMDTTFHELVHLKNPDWTESEVKTLCKYYFLDLREPVLCNANSKRKRRT